MIEHIPELIDAGIGQLEDRGQDEDCTLCGDGGENIPEGIG